MSQWKSVALLAPLGALITCLPVFAHHSFLAEFAQDQPMTVTGTVTRIEWMNPHSFVYVEAKNDAGKTVTWSFETASPSALAMRGWKRDSVRVGDKVIVHGYRARNGSNLAAARLVLLPDGRRFFSGTMDDGGPDQ
jgi:hypothetical protein